MSSRRRKQEIAERDGGWGCRYCGKQLEPILDTKTPSQPERVRDDTPTIDHVVPRSKGGRNNLSNLVLSCPPCNTHKGDQVAKGFVVPKAMPSAKKSSAQRSPHPFGDFQHGSVFDLWVALYGQKRAKRLTSVYPDAAPLPVGGRT